MEKPTLCVDCDGVTFNTIQVGFELMKKMGCDMNNGLEINRYFREKLDWREVFKYAIPINNSLEKIKLLNESGLFDFVCILTGLSGACYEEEIKRDIFRFYLPEIKVITAQRDIPKALVIPNSHRSILVDDELRNCKKFINYGGEAVLFTPNNVDLDNNIINDLMDIPKTKAYKQLTKTRYF